MNDIYLITIDALRNDYLDREHFSECWNHGFEDFAIFKNSYSNGVATPFSFPSIHTGYPVESGGELKNNTPTIAELYTGYTFAISNNPHLRSDKGYHRGFSSFTRNPRASLPLHRRAYSRIKKVAGKSETLRELHDRVWNIRKDFTKNRPNLSPPSHRTAGSVLSTLKSSMRSQSGFYWVHLMDPHYPYYPQKVVDRDLDVDISDSEIMDINQKVRGSAIRNMGLDKSTKHLPPPTEEEIEFCMDMYGKIIEYVDRCVADFFQHLKEVGLWEESMIIVMADHGEAFGEEGIFQHDWSANPIDPLIKVPLLVKYPGNRLAGNTYTHTVQNADLLATLSEVMDWDTNLPDNTRPFTDPGDRPIITKSNNAIRVTTNDGYAIRRDGSLVEHNGSIGDKALSLLQSCSLPTIETQSGEIPGLDQREKEELENRLEHLGYK